MEDKLKQLREELDEGKFGPVTAAGNRISPGHLRGQILKYLTVSGCAHGQFLSDIGVSSSSYSAFMKGKYVDPWAAAKNATYWAAAEFLARQRVLEKIKELEDKVAAKEAKKVSRKREMDAIVVSDDGSDRALDSSVVQLQPPAKKSKKALQQEYDETMAAIMAVELPDPCPVYANCDEVRRMISLYLTTTRFPKTKFLKDIRVCPNGFKNFMSFKGKGAGAANSTYVAAWRFFEKKRLLEKKPKSAKRLEQEQRWGAAGFPLEHDNGTRFFFPGQYNVNAFDIEWCQDRRRLVV